MEAKRKVHIRWDRIGLSILAFLCFVFEYMAQDYPALLWEAIASLLMVLLFREQDRALNAMQTAVKCAMIINAITDGDNDGNTEA